MVCLMDIGDAHTIHPKEKKQVGERFAYLALGKAYGKKGSLLPDHSTSQCKLKEIK